MIPAYIIHNSAQENRKDIVNALINATEAIIVEAVWDPENPNAGCIESHKKVARLAKKDHPLSPYLVFEDDCEIVDPSFLNLLKEHTEVDLLYFGVNGFCVHDIPFVIRHSWGTHAMYITPKVRDTFLKKEGMYLNMRFPSNKKQIDHLFCIMEHCEKWKSWKPSEDTKTKWVRQKPGLISAISGKVRT